MTDYPDLLADRLRPEQLRLRREKADIAFLPLGNIEWHGLQNPLGVDGLSALHTCCRAARLLEGGVVFPILRWGVPRDSFNVGIAGPDAAPVARAFGTDPGRWQGFCPHGGMDLQEQWIFYQRLLRMTLEQIAGYGFRSIYLCSGHGPLIHFARPVAIAFSRATLMAGQPVTTDWGGVSELAGLKGDHGGKVETSLMMALDARMVDLGELERHPEYKGLGAGGDAVESAAAHGEAIFTAAAAGLAAETRWLIENHPKLPARHLHRR
jgi:creatinine amidohydrolase